MGRFTAGTAAVLRGLFARETLPPPPERPAPRAAPGPLRRLVAPDPFPADLPPAPRRPGRWLAWLFAAEPLDP